MKKIFYSIAIVAIMVSGCKKDEPKDNGGATGSQTAPESYKQKMLLEYYSGTWCGYCPDGVTYAKNLHSNYPTNFTYIVAHNGSGDPMQTTESASLAGKYATGYPTGMINRTGTTGASRDTWGAAATSANSKTPPCGLAIDATDATKIKVKLGIGKTDLNAGNYKLHVYGVVKSVIKDGGNAGKWPNIRWDQTNYYYHMTGAESNPFYNKGDYSLKAQNGADIWFIENKNYAHEQVLADILTPAYDGQAIDVEALKAGKITSFEFALDKGQYTSEDFEIIAFISNSDLSVQVINVQFVDLGKAISFD